MSERNYKIKESTLKSRRLRDGTNLRQLAGIPNQFFFLFFFFLFSSRARSHSSNVPYHTNQQPPPTVWWGKASQTEAAHLRIFQSSPPPPPLTRPPSRTKYYYAKPHSKDSFLTSQQLLGLPCLTIQNVSVSKTPSERPETIGLLGACA